MEKINFTYFVSTKIHHMRSLLPLFFIYVRAICDYSASGTSYSVSTFELAAKQRVCVNATLLPLYLIFYDVPENANVFYYRQIVENSNQKLVYSTQRKEMPYAIRSLDTNSSFAIQATESSNITIGVVAVATCLDGIVILQERNRSLTFGNSYRDEFNLAPGDNKCLLVMNNFETVIKASLSLVPNVDFLYFYESTFYPQQFTSNVNATFNKRNNDKPFLFRIVVSPKLLADRMVSFEISSEQKIESHNIAFGKYNITHPTMLPKPSKLIVNDYSIPKGTLIVLISSLIILSILSIFSLVKYNRRCKKCISNDTKYLPPSSFF